MITPSCSIGVMAYNEEANIRFAIEALLKQRVHSCNIIEIVVVASGCTDDTEKIVESIAKLNQPVCLLVQKKREGKASAINLFLSIAKGDLIVVESGDTIPENDTIEKLVQPFQDPNVGMTGARPIPVNSNDTFMGFTAHLFWKLHHQIALNHPKLGEMIAFRNIVREIPKETAVDEASIEAIVTQAGYQIHYAENAIVRNKGPETVTDFLKQRRRITIGHKHLKKSQGYTVSTMKISNLLGLFIRLVIDMRWDPKSAIWTFGAMSLELLGRLLGEHDYYVKKKTPFAWDIAKSTKNLKNVATHT